MSVFDRTHWIDKNLRIWRSTFDHFNWRWKTRSKMQKWQTVQTLALRTSRADTMQAIMKLINILDDLARISFNEATTTNSKRKQEKSKNKKQHIHSVQLTPHEKFSFVIKWNLYYVKSNQTNLILKLKLISHSNWIFSD